MSEILGYVLFACGVAWMIYVIYGTRKGLSDGKISVDLINNGNDVGHQVRNMDYFCKNPFDLGLDNPLNSSVQSDTHHLMTNND